MIDLQNSKIDDVSISSYLVSGSKSGKDKKPVPICDAHSIAKEFVHLQSRTHGCQQCMVDAGRELSNCVNARDYCDAMTTRFIVLLDAATFMKHEHIQKEKEYGITWRSAFKTET